jgi:transposase
MSKHRSIVLSSEQHQQLENLIRSGQAKARTINRARILLLSDRSEYGTGHDLTGTQIAQSLLCSRGTVEQVRKRFLDEGLEAALYERPRPGAKPKITGEVEARLIALACSSPPPGHTSWTLQMLADQLVELKLVESISAVAVHYRLKQTLSNRGWFSPGVFPKRHRRAL